MAHSSRPPGLYEELVNRRLEVALEEIRGDGWRDEVEFLNRRSGGLPVLTTT